MLIDAHCHLADDLAAAALERARLAGVSGAIVVGTDLPDSRRVLTLVKGRNDCQAAVGVHPHEANTWTDTSEAELAVLIADPAVRFVGEAGLDWHYDFSPREVQESVFRAQIRLARASGKPLMIHTREAAADTLRILKEEHAEACGGVFHCFSEDRAFAAQALDLGFHLSFSGIITFKTAEEQRAVVAWAPLDRILVETDSPYLAPVPHRGKRNEPALLPLTAKALADLRGLSVEALAESTTRNLEALCGWPASC